MERPGGALRYAELDATTAFTSTRDDRVRAGEATKNAAQKATQGNGRKEERDGSRSLLRLEQRMRARRRSAELREALDLVRQDELLDGIARRHARRRQRRWYVLGRTLDALMEEDTALRMRLLVLLDEHLVRDDERALFAFNE